MRQSIAFAFFLLASCAAQPAADSAATFHVLSDPPAKGAARIYIFVGSTFVGDRETAYLNSFDVRFDGVLIGALNHGEAMAFDVKPGDHLITRLTKTVWGTSMNPIYLRVTVGPGEKRYFAVDRYMNGMRVTDLSFLLVRGRVAGAGAGMETVPAYREPGDYIEERGDGPEAVQTRQLVLPNPGAAAALVQ